MEEQQRQLSKAAAKNVANNLSGAKAPVESPWKALRGETCKPKPHKRQDAHWRAILALQKLEGRSLGPEHFQQVRRVGRGDVGSVQLVRLKGSNLQFAMKARIRCCILTRDGLRQTSCITRRPSRADA